MKKVIFAVTVGTIITLSFFSMCTLNSCASNSITQNEDSGENISFISTGIYYENEEKLLITSFIYAVNRWLRRYSPQLIIQNENYVKMCARYGYLYDIELFIKNDIFEIVVTFADGRRPPSDVQEDTIHLSTGILRVMADYIANRSRTGR